MGNLLNSAMVATEDGKFVSAEHQRIAELIQDYDPDLHLAWIPPENRTLQDTHPWAVLHMQVGHPVYVALTAENCDHRIVARLWEHDNKTQNVLSLLETEEAALQAIKLKRDMDAADERKDLVKSIARSPLNDYRVNGKNIHRAG